MAKKKRFVFLTDEFYNAYPAAVYPEIEQKKYRPYSGMCGNCWHTVCNSVAV